MGLLNKAEKSKKLLDELTKKKEKYIDHVGEKTKKIIMKTKQTKLNCQTKKKRSRKRKRKTKF